MSRASTPPKGGSYQSLVKKLKAERLRLGLSLEQVAERSGIKASNLSRLENDLDVNPTERTLRAIANALSVDFEVKRNTISSRVLTFYNAAGGSGKTTLVREIGAILADRGYKVLLIDMDPQSTLTYSMGIDANTISMNETIIPAIWALQNEQAPPPLSPRSAFGLHLIPGSGMLSNIDSLLRESRYFTILERYIDSFRDDYDFIFIDPTPFPGGLVSASIRASDGIVVPMAASVKSTWGFNEARKHLSDLLAGKPSLRFVMFVLNQMDDTKHAQELEQWAREVLSKVAPVSNRLANRPAIYKDALMSEVPIIEYGTPSKRKQAEDELNQLADELLKELGLGHA